MSRRRSTDLATVWPLRPTRTSHPAGADTRAPQTVGEPPPGQDASAPRGWYRHSTDPDDVLRWWTGNAWSPARRAREEATDVAQHINQAAVEIMLTRGTSVDRVTAVLARSWPPCRIVAIAPMTYHSGGTDAVVVVIEW